jgi:Putative restriction endonuclease
VTIVAGFPENSHGSGSAALMHGRGRSGVTLNTMPFWPDIVVTKSDSPEVLLTVEVKASSTDVLDSERQLKAYMASTGCPAGMLVTPEQTRFYRNRYTEYGPESVQTLGETATSALLEGIPRQAVTEEYLARRAEEWLESLRLQTQQSWPPSVREPIESIILPIVLGGSVRAGGPRWRKTGS